MNFKGSQTYKTVYGAIVSISMIFFIGFYTLVSILRLVTYGQPEFVVNTVLKDMWLDYSVPFNATENHFEFAIAYLSIRPYKFVEPDPRMGIFEMRRVE